MSFRPYRLTLSTLTAGLALALVLPGCSSSKTCDTALRTYEVSMERTLDVQLAKLDRATIDVCLDAQCARAGAPDSTGAQSFQGNSGRDGHLTVSSASDGRAVLALQLTVGERGVPAVVKVTAHDASGAAFSASGTVTFHEILDGCHFAPDSTSI